MVLRWLIGNYARNLARQKIREKVVEVARQEFAGVTKKSPAAQAEEDWTCDVALVFALGVEAGGLEDLLADTVTVRAAGFVLRRGRLGGRSVAVVQSGLGRSAAAGATRALVEGHRPKWVLSAGFAGGLTDDLKRFDVLMADSLVDVSGDRLSIDLNVDPESLAATPGVHVGPLLTVDRIVRLPSEKRELGAKHQAKAVDMETFAVAEVCRDLQTRLLSVRIIIDAVDDELPADLRRLVEQKTSVRKLGAVAGAVWNRPAAVKDMLKLKEDALVATDRLAKFLASMIEQLE